MRGRSGSVDGGILSFTKAFQYGVMLGTAMCHREGTPVERQPGRLVSRANLQKKLRYG